MSEIIRSSVRPRNSSADLVRVRVRVRVSVRVRLGLRPMVRVGLGLGLGLEQLRRQQGGAQRTLLEA